MSEETKNTAFAKAKSLKTSIQKVNLVLKMIRGKKAENALNILAFSNKRISNEITKVLKSAIANAENNHQLDIDKLFIKEATAGKSMTLKRFRPRARGRSGKILKPYSKIKILLEEATELKKTDEKQIDESKKNLVESDKGKTNKVEKTEEKQDIQTKKNLTEDNKDGTKN